MKLSTLTFVACEKCSKALPLQRHHRGCERMWLKHFRSRRRSKRYKEFYDRYYEFRDTDCVPLCAECHDAIHLIYRPIISMMVATEGFRPCRQWTWVKAEKLMLTLRQTCDQWLAGVSQ